MLSYLLFSLLVCSSSLNLLGMSGKKLVASNPQASSGHIVDTRKKLQEEVAGVISPLLLPDLWAIVCAYMRTSFMPKPLNQTKDYDYQLLCLEVLSPGKYLIGTANSELIEWDTNTGVKRVINNGLYWLDHMIRLNDTQCILAPQKGLMVWNGGTSFDQISRGGTLFLARLSDAGFIQASRQFFKEGGAPQYCMNAWHYNPDSRGFAIKRSFDLKGKPASSGCLVSEQQFVTCARDTIRVWNSNQTQAVRSITLDKDRPYVHYMAPLTDQQLLATAGSQIILCDLNDGKILKTFECADKESSADSTGSGRPTFIGLAALDNKRFVSAFKGVIYQWHVDKDQPERTYDRVYQDHTPYCIKALPNGRFLSAGNTAHLWESDAMSEFEKAITDAQPKSKTLVASTQSTATGLTPATAAALKVLITK